MRRVLLHPLLPPMAMGREETTSKANSLRRKLGLTARRELQPNPIRDDEHSGRSRAA
jgi:hypothetical protein